MMASETAQSAELTPPDLPEWKTRDLLAFEKELLGVYVSGHPLTEYEAMLKTFIFNSLARLPEVQNDTGVRIGGLITSVDLKLTKKDNRAWAVIGLEGLDGTIECLAFPEAYEKAKADLILETPVLIEGLLNVREGDAPKITVERVIPLEKAPEELTSEIHLRINQKKVTEPQLQRLLELCQANPGTVGVTICVICDNGDIAFLKPGTCTIRNSMAFHQAVLDLLGPDGLVEKVAQARRDCPAAFRGSRQQLGSECGARQRAGRLKTAANLSKDRLELLLPN